MGPNGTDYSGTWISTQPRNGSDICDWQSWLVRRSFVHNYPTHPPGVRPTAIPFTLGGWRLCRTMSRTGVRWYESEGRRFSDAEACGPLQATPPSPRPTLHDRITGGREQFAAMGGRRGFKCVEQGHAPVSFESVHTPIHLTVPEGRMTTPSNEMWWLDSPPAAG
jgi:hypothetical protein